MRRELLLVLLVLPACGPGGDDAGACADILPGDLVITEVFADYDAPTGTGGADDGKEWFEVYNASSAPIDMQDIVVTHARPDGSSDHSHTMGTLTIQPGEYAVLGNVTPEFVTGYLDYGYGTDLSSTGFFNTDGGRITLACGDTTIDDAQYGTASPGQSFGFDGGVTPDFTANDDLVNWCDTPADDIYAYIDGNYGTPGAANFDCAVVTPGQCLDAGSMRATVPPILGDLIITEVHPNPSGDDSLEEWFELYAVSDVDLNGVQVARSTGNPETIDSEDCLHVAAGEYVVIAKTTEMAMNGNLPPAAIRGLFGLSLVDTGDLHINDPGGTLLDAVTWTNAGAGKTRQVDPDFVDPTGNDAENVWCDATAAWAAADLGSPGVANEQCTILPPAGQCHDVGLGADRDIVEPTVGQLVITEVHPNPDGTDSVEEWFEARTTAAIDLNGLKLQRTGATPGSSTILVVDCISIPANTYVLFSRPGATHVPTADATYDGFDLVDTCDTTNNCDVRITLGDDTLIDAVTWNNADSSSTNGLSARQLDLDFVADATGNDTQANWCDATTPYNTGLDNGTPRADNVQCP